MFNERDGWLNQRDGWLTREVGGYMGRWVAKWREGLGNRKLGDLGRWVNKLER